MEFFGLDKTDPDWFVSLLERLRELSKIPIDDFLKNPQMQNSWRYHPIDWNAKNCPIVRGEIDTVPDVYRENAEEYPYCQFMISRGLGRVVGFLDEHKVFNILLLDPLHNIQPSKSYEYKVDDCSPLACKYSGLMLKVEAAKATSCMHVDCDRGKKIGEIGMIRQQHNCVLIEVDENIKNDVNQVFDNHADVTWQMVLTHGLFSILEDKERSSPQS